MANSYYLLLLAILFEVCGLPVWNFHKVFLRLLSSILIFAFYAISFFLFTLVIKGMDISIAYAVWAKLGTALITVIGIFGFKSL